MIEIIYKKEYFNRDLFVLKINDKYASVYKSSGLSGTGHQGQIFPFMDLNTERRFSDPVVGYIFKKMFYNGEYTNHRKRPEDFEGLSEKLEQIKEFLKDQKIPSTSPDLNNESLANIYIKDISRNLNKYYSNPQFDWKEDAIPTIDG